MQVLSRRLGMTKLAKEVLDDLRFIRGHRLQPQWYKIFKVFMIIGFLAGYYYLFGSLKTIIFVCVFFLLGLTVHMIYRIKTHTWRQSWLDFKVEEQEGVIVPVSIGKFYYMAVAINIIIALVMSQVFVE
jgi:hypothetical protein